MVKTILSSLCAILLAPALFGAAAAVIEKRDGTTQSAYSIESEVLGGVSWLSARNQAGTRVDLWDLAHVRYNGQFFDQYNSMPRKLVPIQARRLQQDAESYLADKQPTTMTPDEWNRVLLACRFYIAAAQSLQGNHEAAIEKYTEYLKEAEAKVWAGAPRGPFRSVVGNREIATPGGLHRLYLDGLEGLGMAYLAAGDAQKANDLAFKPLQELSAALTRVYAGRSQYWDWSIRALRALASQSEARKDYKAAREAYESLLRTAQTREGGRQSRATYEASLKVGFMSVMEGDLGSARTRFFEAVRTWEAAHNENEVKDSRGPRANWITSDVAYFTAGCYVGQGMVDAARASTSAEWASALRNFSTALSVFRSDDEIRSLALLGAAHAASQMAEANATNAAVANVHARLAEKYLSELTSQLPKSAAAKDEKVAQAQARVTKYKKD